MPAPTTQPLAGTIAAIPAARRIRLAATLGLFAVLFVAVGTVAATGPGTFLVRAFSVIALVAAVLLALMSWGVLHSVRVERADRALGAAVDEVVAAHPGRGCGCGHEHDPTEMHITDADPTVVKSVAEPAGCGHDGAGRDCAHTCETCVLARPRPTVATSRPSPRPRPAPDGQSNVGLPSRP